MAKHKRKIYSSQRDKVAIETAKILKRKGVLSKQTKLHGGKYVSRGVLKKVQEYQSAAKPHYTTVKVPKAVAKRAKDEGYQVSNQRVIVPKDHDFIKRVKRGELAGIKPVKGGFMSEVKLPFEASNYDELLALLDREDLDSLKLPGEVFAFQVSGTQGSPMGMSYRTFFGSKEIKEYLRHYKPEVFISGLKFYRLHPEDERAYIWGPEQRRKFRKQHPTKQDRRQPNRKRTESQRMQRLKEQNPRRYNLLMEQKREKWRQAYEKKKKDPHYIERARERALDSWRRRNPPKGRKKK